MCHQPFENWIIEQAELGVQDRRLLEEHLETCPQCKRLSESMRAVHIRLTTAGQMRPAPGFTARWEMTLQKRLEEQRMKQVLQVRRFFLFLGTATVLSLVLLLLFGTLGGGLFHHLTGTLNRLASTTELIETIQGYVFALLQIAPPAIPIAIWVTVTTVFSALALIWVVSLWRITFQGDKSR